jgi:hypothetical protein
LIFSYLFHMLLYLPHVSSPRYYSRSSLLYSLAYSLVLLLVRISSCITSLR